MLLLYCTNAIVRGTHDDAQSVDKSVYGTGVRVIPWSDLLGALPKAGAAPPAGQPDTRPYAQPTETTALLVAYSSQVRFEMISAGFSFTAASGVVPVSTDRESYMLVGNTAQYAATLPPTSMIDFTQNGAHYPLTAAEMAALFKQFSALIQTNRTIEADCIADIKSTTPTIKLYGDVDAKFAASKE